ncbi:MAG: biotin--[acetyl-CoA-carboxylase] ligase [Cyanobacteria bacterium M_surface_10_m2_179]|nr:biotin--[acetyl-CoA-carboxylase] ligase [Cyanobacteria bacterium M_surface_10_m2_179]
MAGHALNAASIAAALRPLPADQPLPWQLKVLPVCASTEVELEGWLRAAAPPLAVLARQQRRGQGQQGRVWQSPPGGVWLSAALPWPAHPEAAASLALAAAVGVALQLETLGLQPQLKWPNDLLIDGRKLAGILPRLRWRGGRVRYAQLGVGLNGVNRVPPGAVSVASALGHRWHPQAQPARLAARLLRGLEWAAAAAHQPELVRRQAEQRLWRPPWWEHEGQRWQVAGLAPDGGLRLRSGSALAVVQRRF